MVSMAKRGALVKKFFPPVAIKKKVTTHSPKKKYSPVKLPVPSRLNFVVKPKSRVNKTHTIAPPVNYSIKTVKPKYLHSTIRGRAELRARGYVLNKSTGKLVRKGKGSLHAHSTVKKTANTAKPSTQYRGSKRDIKMFKTIMKKKTPWNNNTAY